MSYFSLSRDRVKVAYVREQGVSTCYARRSFLLLTWYTFGHFGRVSHRFVLWA